jgi:hypothetical protein
MKGDLRRLRERTLKRMVHAYWKASASESRRKLEGKLAPELLEEVVNAIKWRDRLAHRYLREHMAPAKDSRTFQPGTLEELVNLTDGFTRLGQRLGEEYHAITADWPKEGTPPEVKTALEGAGRRVFYGGVLPEDAPNK